MMTNHTVYFLSRPDGLLKIGYSSSFERRFGELQKSHEGLTVVRLLNGDRRREKQIHHICRAHHEYGEWFRDSAELRDIIQELEDGFVHEVADEPSDAIWKEFEAGMTEIVSLAADKLIALCFGTRSDTLDGTTKYIEDTYGIAAWRVRRLHRREISNPSAALYEAIRYAFISESKKHLEELQKEVSMLRAQECADSGLFSLMDRIEELEVAHKERRQSLERSHGKR